MKALHCNVSHCIMYRLYSIVFIVSVLYCIESVLLSVVHVNTFYYENNLNQLTSFQNIVHLINKCI